ncbi:MAG: pirin family protein [Chloroflexi bacterium]|nr:pirin family protein [Chloroflexota bacterium]
MIAIRRSEERGHADFGWLDSRHTFSFGQYHDPAHRGFSVLRVINQDRVAPGHGFPMHPHRDFEIFSYILNGSLSHEDTTGVRATVHRHDVQLISAGTGMAHSEANPSSAKEVHFLQVWLQTNRPGLEPVYSQAAFGPDAKAGRLCLIMSPDRVSGSLAFRQDARIFATVLRDGDRVAHILAPGRVAWLHVATGALSVNDVSLNPGDGASFTGESSVRLTGTAMEAEALLFDLPA